jgi:toxin YoeB
MIRIFFSPEGWEDYLFWQTQDKKTLRRINRLIEDISRNGLEGIGKTEPLSGDLSGYWSKRIDDKNRMVFRITDDVMEIIKCREHYYFLLTDCSSIHR